MPRKPPTPTITEVTLPSADRRTSFTSPTLLLDASYTFCLYQSVTVTLWPGTLLRIFDDCQQRGDGTRCEPVHCYLPRIVCRCSSTSVRSESSNESLRSP